MTETTETQTKCFFSAHPWHTTFCVDLVMVVIMYMLVKALPSFTFLMCCVCMACPCTNISEHYYLKMTAIYLQLMDTSTIQFGPCASDVAIFLASQIYFYNFHMLTPQNNDKHRRVAYKLMDVCKHLGNCNQSAVALFKKFWIYVHSSKLQSMPAFQERSALPMVSTQWVGHLPILSSMSL